MLYTDNIGLKKPAYSDPADIADINENMDTIDREFSNRYLKSETYSVEQADNAIAQAIAALPNGLVYRGAVNYYKDLPTANNELGDTYSVKYQGETGTTADGNEYAWGEYDGTLQWIKLGVNAYTKDEIDTQHNIIKSDILTAKNDIAVNCVTLGTQSKNCLEITATSKTAEATGGLTITVNDDKSITINGMVSSNYKFNVGTFATREIKNYLLSGCPSGGGGTTYQLFSENSEYNIYNYTNNSVNFTPKTKNKQYFTIIIYKNVVCDNVTFYPMIRPADITDGTYEPYKPSLQEQINALIGRIQALETAQTTTTLE